MPETAQCPVCQKSYVVKPELAGKRVKCKCGEKFTLPGAPAKPSAASAAEPLEQSRDPYDVVDHSPKKPAAPAGDSVACAGCGEALAAGAVLCTKCGYNQRTGKKVQTQVAPTLPYRSGASPGINPATVQYRASAGRTCMALAVLMYLGGTCAGVATVLFFAMAGSADIASRLPPGLAASAGLVLVGATAITLAIATTYLICGINIRKGGFVSVIVALVLGSLQAIVAVLNVIGGAMALASGEGNFIALGIQLLFALALGQLVYNLIRILAAGRGAA